MRSRKKTRNWRKAFFNKVCDDFGIDRKRPIVTQISRFDRLKDPVGVIQAYKLARRSTSIANSCSPEAEPRDDPEGAVVLKEVKDAAGRRSRHHHPQFAALVALEINALQRASTIVVQKSIKEGFGLTVTEALWKRKADDRRRGRRNSDPGHS